MAAQFTEYERTTKLPQCLNEVQNRRRASMGEAVNLLAHMEKYEHVPPLCSQLLEQPESEQDEIRWLFHRGRAYVKWAEQQYYQAMSPLLQRPFGSGNPFGKLQGRISMAGSAAYPPPAQPTLTL